MKIFLDANKYSLQDAVDLIPDGSLLKDKLTIEMTVNFDGEVIVKEDNPIIKLA